jgi:aminocarboxymuconate-semialdehyde decarboxylase
VDIHAHLGVASAETRIRQDMPDLPRGMPFSCPASDAVNARMFAKIGPSLNGVTERIADMDRLGVDVQAISPNPGQYYYF